MDSWYTLDDFETGSLASTWYSGNTVFTAGSARVLAGSYSLNVNSDSPYFGDNTTSYMFNSTFSSGTDAGSLARFKSFNNANAIGDDRGIKFLFYSNGSNSFYEYRNRDIKTEDQELKLYKVQNGSETLLSSFDTTGGNDDSVASVEIFNNAGSIVINAYSGADYTVSLGSITAVDTTFVSGTFGVGINTGYVSGQGVFNYFAWDNIQIYGESGGGYTIYAITPSDSLSLPDSTQFNLVHDGVHTFSKSETISLTELAEFNYVHDEIYAITPSDALTLSDSLDINKSTKIIAKSISDTVSLVDSLDIAKSPGTYAKAISDSLTLIENINFIEEPFIHVKTFSDITNLSENLSIIKSPSQYRQSISDSLSLTETSNFIRAKNTYIKSISDNLSLTETTSFIEQPFIHVKTFSDSISLLENVSIIKVPKQYTKSISDSLSLTEVTNFIKSPSRYTKSISDSFGFIEGTNFIYIKNIILDDGIILRAQDNDFIIKGQNNSFIYKAENRPRPSPPLCHWKCNDNADNQIVVDSMGLCDGQTEFNTDTYSVNGKINKALNVYEGAYLVNTAIVPLKLPYSFSTWFKVAKLPSAYGSLVSIFHEEAFITIIAGTGLYLGTDNKIKFDAKNTAGSTTTIESNNAISVDTWYHVVGLIDENMNLSMYVDNVLQNDEKQRTGTKQTAGIGFLATSVINFGSGDITVDDMRYYQRIITPNEIDLIYNDDVGTEEQDFYDYNPIVIKAEKNTIDLSSSNSLNIILQEATT